MSRRDFGALAAGGLSLVASAELEGQIPAGGPPLDIAEWSDFWVGVERADLARGTVVSGKQMYVEYQIPARVRRPYPIVLVHGGRPLTPQTPWGLTDVPLTYDPPVSD